MKKVIYLSILLIIASYPVKSQMGSANPNYPGRILGSSPPWPDYTNYYEGTRYLQDEFINGEVDYYGSGKSIQVPLRLNLHNDQFEYMENDSVLAIRNPNHIDKIVVGNDVYIYLKSSPQVNVKGFVKIWNTETPAIITKMKTNYYSKQISKGYTELKPARFERVPDRHYILNSDSEIDRIKSVKKLIKYLGSHQEELSQFAKENKISASDPEELAKLLDYFQELEQLNEST